ncbi:MAG TPA: helix-turn-helix domain-containing protein [Candidatus Limnocylindrales bacterium]|nr:helix-turn-helix domain-containing protein [Candidatus Limnocylindrales bacterium]
MADLAIAARPAYEFLLSVTAFVTPHRVDSYDIGPSWFADAEAALGPAESEGLRALTSGCEHVLVRLLSVAHDLPAPGSANDLLARLEAMSSDDLRLTLLGYYSRRTRRRAAPEEILAAARGDPDAQRSFVTSTADGPDCEAALRSLLGRPPDELRAALLARLRTWLDRVFMSQMASIGPVLEREVDRLRHRAAELDQDRFLEEATHGGSVVAEPGTDTIELFPHWSLRPWNIFWEHGSAQIVGVPVPAEHATVDPDDPPDRLVSLAKALGDERRLRILRRLSGGSYTLQELADHFAIPKTTLLHHLVMLRAAGIVRVGPGTAGRYSLRPEVPRELQRLLESYLPVVPRDGRPSG